MLPQLQDGLWAFASRRQPTASSAVARTLGLCFRHPKKSSAAVRTLGLSFPPSTNSIFSCSTDSWPLLPSPKEVLSCSTDSGPLLPVNLQHLEHGLWAFASRRHPKKSSAAVRTLGLCFPPSTNSIFSCSAGSGPLLPAVTQKSPQLQYGLWAFASRRHAKKSSAAVRTLGRCFPPSTNSIFSCSTDSGPLLPAVTQKSPQLQYGLWAFASRRHPKKSSAAVRTLGRCFPPSTNSIFSCSTDSGPLLPAITQKSPQLQYGLWAFASRRQPTTSSAAVRTLGLCFRHPKKSSAAIRTLGLHFPPSPKKVLRCSTDSGPLLPAVNYPLPSRPLPLPPPSPPSVLWVRVGFRV